MAPVGNIGIKEYIQEVSRFPELNEHISHKETWPF